MKPYCRLVHKEVCVSPNDTIIYTVIPEAAVTPALDVAIRDALVICFPKDAAHFSTQRWWHSPHHWTVAAFAGGGTFIGGMCIVERTITVDGKDISAAGIGNVCTLPAYRGQGIVDRIMKTALDEAKRRGIEAGLLFCKPALEKVYGRMGWRRLDVTVVMDDGAGNAVPPKETDIVMAIPLSLAAFPPGKIDLNGRDW